MTDRELLQEAFKYLKDISSFYGGHRSDKMDQLMLAIEIELAEPDQEECLCCGDYERCLKPCTPRGRWQGEQNAFAQTKQKPVEWDDDEWVKKAMEMLRDFVERAKKNWESPSKGVSTITMAELRQTDLYRHIRAELGGELVRFKEGEWSYVRKPWAGLTDTDLMKEFGYTDELLRDTAYRVEQLLKGRNT